MTLDTSGRVLALPHAPHAAPAYCWADLTLFQRGFIRQMYEAHRATFPRVDGSGSVTIFDFDRLAPVALAAILEDCVAFQSRPTRWVDTEVAGAAWWDDRAQGSWTAHGYRPVDPFIGDDDLIYLRGDR